MKLKDSDFSNQYLKLDYLKVNVHVIETNQSELAFTVCKKMVRFSRFEN